MPVVTPSSGTYEIPELKDHDPYKGRVVAFEVGTNEYKGKQSTRIIVDLALSEDDEDTLRDWIPVALGVSRDTGQVSKLRTFLNALSDQPKATKVEWFKTETQEWGYEPYNPNGAQNPATTNQLSAGMEVIFRGENGFKEDGSRKFKISTYQSLRELERESQPKSNGRRAPQPVGSFSGQPPGAHTDDDSKVPF